MPTSSGVVDSREYYPQFRPDPGVTSELLVEPHRVAVEVHDVVQVAGFRVAGTRDGDPQAPSLRWNRRRLADTQRADAP